MTFKTVAFRNFVHGIRKYLMFFICNTFTVAIFFIFATLLFNEGIAEFFNGVGAGAEFVLFIALVILGAFALVFTIYVHGSLRRSRGKEFGLYLTLGMSRQDIRRLIVIEDGLISLTSLCLGILGGLLFSKLVHMAAARLMGLGDLHFNLDARSFLLTVAVFTATFALVILSGIVSSSKLGITDLLKAEKAGDKAPAGSGWKLLLAVALILGFLATAIAAILSRDLALDLRVLIPSLGAGLAGVYLLIPNILVAMLRLTRKKARSGYGNLLALTEAQHAIGQNRKLIFVLCILSAVIIFTVSSTSALYLIVDDIAEISRGADLEYIQAFGVNTFEYTAVDRLIGSSGAGLVGKEQFPCHFAFVQGEEDDGLPVLLISDGVFEKISGKKKEIPPGSAILAVADRLDAPKGLGTSLCLSLDGLGVREYILVGTVEQKLVSSYVRFKWLMVVNDGEYEEIRALSLEMEGIIHKYYFSDWRKSQSIFSGLNEIKESEDPEWGQYLFVSGTYYGYKLMKKLFSTFSFIFNFISILFFAAAAMVLILRHYESLYRARAKYAQVRKIGVTEKEYSRVLKSALRIMFFLPPLLGIVQGYGLMLFCESMVGGNEVVASFMKTSAFFSLGYLLLQALVYKAAATRYCRDVMLLKEV